MHKWHSIMLTIGVFLDVVSTFLMYKLGGSRFSFGIHDIFGYIALVLMLINAIRSIIIVSSRKDNNVYKFSFFVWIIWIISYVLGVTAHM